MALKQLTIAFCAMVFSTAPLANDISKFNEFFEGAMKVYSKFQEPSKQESEQFYSFIKQKWNNKSCEKRSCSTEGLRAGEEYAMINQVKLDNGF